MKNLIATAMLVVAVFPAGTKDPHAPSQPLRSGLPHQRIDEYCGRIGAPLGPPRGVDIVQGFVRYPDVQAAGKDCVLYIVPELRGITKGSYVLGLFDTEKKDWLKDLYPFEVK